MKRSPMPPRRSRIAPKKRTPSEKTRIYGSPQRIAWLHATPCIITGRVPCEVVHVKAGGVGYKAGCEWTVPMIPEMHRELHRIGIRSFEARYAVPLAGHTLAAHAARVQAEWLGVEA